MADSSMLPLLAEPMLSLRPHTIFTPMVDRFFALACVGVIFAMAYPRQLPLVIGLLLAAVIGFELLQRLIPGRHGFDTDMLVKGAGACTGVFAGYALRRLIGFRRWHTANTE